MFILLILGIVIIVLLVMMLSSQKKQIHNALSDKLNDFQVKNLQALSDGLQKGRLETNEHIRTSLNDTRAQIVMQMEKLAKTTEERLNMISGVVDKRLNEGFEKTHQTFADVIKRLALIDQAQQKITELSTNVVSLKDLLNDKRSRGAFGEVQLTSLIRNVLPESHFGLQTTLSNGKRADCVLYLPEPTGTIAIDAKFPLENFQKMTSTNSDIERKVAEQQFKQDIKKHIQDIADKYIIPGETTDGAMMFIPAEAIFAEIHAHHPELVTFANQSKVWMTSPTTMMAVLTTARAVLKDDATKKQVHIIQEHLSYLSQDFDRFQKRMDGLERHIQQAHDDVKQVNISAKKITGRFEKIEQVELDTPKSSSTLEHTS